MRKRDSQKETSFCSAAILKDAGSLTCNARCGALPGTGVNARRGAKVGLRTGSLFISSGSHRRRRGSLRR